MVVPAGVLPVRGVKRGDERLDDLIHVELLNRQEHVEHPYSRSEVAREGHVITWEFVFWTQEWKQSRLVVLLIKGDAKVRILLMEDPDELAQTLLEDPVFIGTAEVPHEGLIHEVVDHWQPLLPHRIIQGVITSRILDV